MKGNRFRRKARKSFGNMLREMSIKMPSGGDQWINELWTSREIGPEIEIWEPPACRYLAHEIR